MTGDVRCRICGLHQAVAIWGEDGQTPTYDICACCGAVFGNDDASSDAIRSRRDQWLAKGAPWVQPDRMPKDWNAAEQMKAVPTFYFRVLPGLPGTGPAPLSFNTTGMGMHSEGLVVEFTTDGGATWLGNFQTGAYGATVVVPVPGRRDLAVVVAKGQGYLVEPATRALVRAFGGQLSEVFVLEERRALIFGNGLWFECLGAEGLRWKTRRLSWDGFIGTRVEGDRLRGDAYSPMDDSPAPFDVDMDTGESIGGSYPPELP